MTERILYAPLDPAETDHALACQQISTRCAREHDPAYKPGDSESFLAVLRSEGNFIRHCVIALDTATDRVRGWAMLSYSREFPDDPMYVVVEVDPDARRQGIGTQLQHRIRALCPPERPSRQYFAEAFLPADADATTHPTTRWAHACGWRLNELDRTLRLEWPPEGSNVDALMPSIPPDYTLHTYVNGVPAALRESLGVVRGQMDAEAPSGDIEFSAEAWSEQYYLQHVEEIKRRHATLVETVAVWEGNVVGFTGITIPDDAARLMHVAGTGVLRAHRGKRLGLAMKTEIMRELLARGVANPAIETDTAVDNPWMLAINRAVGFTDYCQLAGYMIERL